MAEDAVIQAVCSIQPGRYAIAVSGGADSVGLLHAVHHRRPEVGLHVIHLDHQTRGEASTGDARFVQDLAVRWGLPATIRRLDEIEPEMHGLPANKSARFRAVRIELFKRVIQQQGLSGVLLAHHADDQAETILQRILRGSRAVYVAGMAAESLVDGVRSIRPLLRVRRLEIRRYLQSAGQAWREDASNESMEYGRNRVRKALAIHDELTPGLIGFADAIAEVRGWIDAATPILAERFATHVLHALPLVLKEEAATRWLIARGVPADEVGPPVLQRLIEMAEDAASPARQQFPGGVMVRRRSGRISAENMGKPDGS